MGNWGEKTPLSLEWKKTLLITGVFGTQKTLPNSLTAGFWGTLQGGPLGGCTSTCVGGTTSFVAGCLQAWDHRDGFSDTWSGYHPKETKVLTVMVMRRVDSRRWLNGWGGLLFVAKRMWYGPQSKAFEDSPHQLLRNPSDAAAEAGIWEGVEGFRNMSSSPESFQNEAFCKKPLTPQKNYYYFFFSKWTVARNFFILIFGGFDSIILFAYKHDTPLMEPEILPPGKRDPFVETSIFKFYVKRWGCTNLFEQWKNPGCLAFLGEYTTQLCVDYNLTIIRITTKQPGFNGK